MKLETKKAYLLLGSNLGNREDYLKSALVLIAQNVGHITAKSSIYETAAWGKTDQPGFLNMAVEVLTSLPPLTVLHEVLNIEQVLGRTRAEKWGARSIDIDVILYANEIVDIKNELQIPHPEMHHRKFVLIPLHEIAPNLLHPVFKKTISLLLTDLNDPLEVSKKP